MKHQLAKQTEQNLRRAASRSPTNRQQRDPEYQRRTAHVAQPFRILMPRPGHFVLGQLRMLCPEVPAVRAQRRHAYAGKQKRNGVERERPLVAELRTPPPPREWP